jgi:hypothetical protein
VTKGRKIIDRFQVVLDDGGRVISSDVYLVKPRWRKDEMSFEVEEKESGIRLSESDISALRGKFEKAVRSFNAIKWDLFLLVKAHAEWCTLEFDWYMVGKRPDGKTVSIKIDEPEAAREWALKPWDGSWDVRKTLEMTRGSYRHVTERLPTTGFRGGRGVQTVEALIPATPENFQAVAFFNHALQKLGRDIVERFRPEKLESSLALLKRAAMMPILTSGDVIMSIDPRTGRCVYCTLEVLTTKGGPQK